MKKYFVVSDIHGFYRQLSYALTMKGFDASNRNHYLIVLGDIFDRGPDPIGVYKFIMSVPKERRILIRGNHEDIYKELARADSPDVADYYNGTVETFCRIAGIDIKEVVNGQFNQSKWDEVLDKVNKSEITAFIKSDEWRNYYELGNYIFVHGFIPASDEFEHHFYIPDWRDITDDDMWMRARWDYAYHFINTGIFDEEKAKGKTLVVGHVSCAIVRQFLDKTNDTDYSIYHGDHFIAIDACTAMSHKVNVLVLQK